MPSSKDIAKEGNMAIAKENILLDNLRFDKVIWDLVHERENKNRNPIYE